MKISQELLKQIDTSQKGIQSKEQTHTSFEQLVQSHTKKLAQSELQKLMNDISLQGDRLSRYRNLKELVRFKRLITRFLDEAVSNGMDLQKSHSFSFSGSSQQLTLVKQVDDKLLELTEAIMNQEKKSVNLLGLIGEIKGLLVNLYM